MMRGAATGSGGRRDDHRIARDGIVFSLDALLAALILIAAIIAISTIVIPPASEQELSAAGQDLLSSLHAMPVFASEDPWVQAQIAAGNFSDPSLSMLEQLGVLWATGRQDDARRLATIMFENATAYGLRLTIDGDELYAKNDTVDNRGTTLIASRMLTGVAEGEAITGSSSVAYLRRIKDKRTSSFVTFGGFVGQGNITVEFSDIPVDANITQIRLELAAGAPFFVLFNDVACGGLRTPESTNGTPSAWDLSACNASLVPGGKNDLSLSFPGEMNTSYVTGGFLRVKYKTSGLSNITTGFVHHHLPGIDGIVNLYDAFYVPGTLMNMTVYLHYNGSNSTFFNIGEKRVWEENSNNTERIVVLNDSYLRDPALGKLDYSFLSNKTIPIRMAGFNPITYTMTGGNADVVLITDFSGSMKKAVSDWDNGNLGSKCDDAYTDNDIRRTLLAQCVDNELIDTVMNYSGNRVWPVFIHNDQIKWYNNPTNPNATKGYIDSYPNGDGKTCLACAVNLAYEILQNQSNSSRNKFIVLMTDGCPTHCASGGCTSNSSVFGAQQCEGLCDTNGACTAGNIPAQCGNCTAFPGGQTNLYHAANRSKNDLNITIFTVGFGPMDACAFGNETLLAVANMTNGTYQHSANSSELRLIYKNISESILEQSILEGQTVLGEGNRSRSRLFPDSHINITYSLAEQYQLVQNQIDLTLQTDQACDPVVDLYAEQYLVEAKAVSYSGTHWTDYVGVNVGAGGGEAFNLSSFFSPYPELGDPSVVVAPRELFHQGSNTVDIQTGDSPSNRTGCSMNNSVIYTVTINLSTERSTVVPNATGCIWDVQFEDDTYENITIPANYPGAVHCSYRAGNITYDATDAYQLGAYTIFERLDFTKSGKLFVNLRDEDLEVIVTTISRVPYLWGPVIVRLEVSR